MTEIKQRQNSVKYLTMFPVGIKNIATLIIPYKTAPNT